MSEACRSSDAELKPSRAGARDRHHADAAQGLLDEVDRLASRADHLNSATDERDSLDRWAQLGMMAAAIAHEINGLLTPLTGYADLALMSPDNERLRERALRSASESGRQAAAVLEAVLELSRAADRHDGKPEVGADAAIREMDGGCRVRELLAAWSKLAEDLGAADRVDVVRSAGVELGDVLPIGLQAAQIVLSNLLKNALKTGPTRRVLLRLSRDEAAWMIDVQDDGSGVPTAMVESVFEWGSTGDERAGHGIGLSLARALSVKAGGQLSLVPSEVSLSDNGEGDGWSGACFRLTLPLVG